MIIPADAAVKAETKLFFIDCRIDARWKILLHAFNDILENVNGFPMLTVTDVAITDANGIIITITVNNMTKQVNGMRHRPRSMMTGRVDFPLMVMYCLPRKRKVEQYNITFAITIKNTASVVASVRPRSVPRCTKSIILVVAV